MADVTISNPDEHRTNVPVQKDGTISIGRKHAGKSVTVVVEVLDDE